MSDTMNLAEIAQISADKSRHLAETGLASARTAFDKSSAVARNVASSLEASSNIVARGMSEFNAKAFEAFQANSQMTLGFFGALAGAKRPSDVVSISSEHGAKQFEALKAQTKDLSSLAQKIAAESAEPFKAQMFTPT